MLSQVISSHWFSIFDLLIVTASGFVWFAYPQAGWWPLLTALLPWLGRLAAGRFPFKRTTFDLPIFIFVMTAGMGVWVAYDPGTAWAKFWLVLASVLIYYAIAAQPKANLKVVYAGVGILGGLVSFALLFDNNLTSYRADLGVIQHLTSWWVSTRPAWLVNSLHPNLAGGILAVLFPFSILLVSVSFRKGEIMLGACSVVLVAITAGGIILSSSRGAWIALLTALLVVLLAAGSRLVVWRLSKTAQLVLLTVFLIGAGMGTISFMRGAAGMLEGLPGLPSGGSRLDLAGDTIHLSADFPFTGGGLAAFPGLYSSYILNIPYLFYEYSHNLYLDVYIEQGLFGLLALVIVLFGSLFHLGKMILKNKGEEPGIAPQLAVLAALVVIMVHGLVDDALYGVQGTSLLFLVPAMGVALDRPESWLQANSVKVTLSVRRKLAWGGFFLVLTVGVIGVLGHLPLRSAWLANLGSVNMAKAELSDFPSNSFEYHPQEDRLDAASAYYMQALLMDPSNFTANYRLGMIGAKRMDYQAALPYLERAFEANHSHRGVRKLLGYTYAWTDQPQGAAELLAGIPEAGQELEAYIWWWSTKQRPDLAGYAQSTLEQLASYQ